MIRHVIVWKLSATDELTKQQDAATIIAALSELPALIPEIRSLSVGTNVAYHERNWDLALVSDYTSLADLEAYRVHPAHQRVVALVKTRVSQRASLDFEL